MCHAAFGPRPRRLQGRQRARQVATKRVGLSSHFSCCFLGGKRDLPVGVRQNYATSRSFKRQDRSRHFLQAVFNELIDALADFHGLFGDAAMKVGGIRSERLPE